MQTITQGTLQTSGGLTLPLESTEITGGVLGPVAEIEVVQVFRNSLDHPIDATYLFPLSHHASVYRMRFEVGGRVVHARLKEREVARADFERARSEGRRATLLEQERPNLFTMQVAAIRPGEAIRVVLGYQQLVEFDDGEYRLVFPLVAADRSLQVEELPDVERLRARRLKARERAADVTVRLRMGERRPESPTHDLIWQDGYVTLAPGDRLPNRDLVLKWRMAAARVGAEVAYHRPEGHPGTFLLSVLPPADVSSPLGSRDLVILYDRSCSMQGQTTEQARRAVDHLLEGCERFQLLAFDHEVVRFSEDFVGRERGAEARLFLRDQAPRGGTDLGYALQQLPASGQVVLLTDATVANEEELVKRLNGRRLFVLGLGAAVNRYLVERLARAGGGAFEVLTPFEEPTAVLERFSRRLRLGGPLASGVTAAWEGVQPTGVRLSADSFYGGQPLTVAGRFTEAGPARLVLTGTDGFRWEHDLHLPEVAADFPALEREWARRCLDGRESREGKVALALRYGLLCEYTALVGEDEEASPVVAEAVEVVGPEVAGSPMDARKKRGLTDHRLACRAEPLAFTDRVEASPARPSGSGDYRDRIAELRSRRAAGSGPVVEGLSPAPRRPESVVCCMMAPSAAPASGRSPEPAPPVPALPADPYADHELGVEVDGALDLVFLMDETGSMGSWIGQVQRDLVQLLAQLRTLPLCRELRVGLVRYCDHPPQDSTFVTRVHPLTADVGAIRTAVREMRAAGGGDYPEAVTDGLYELCGLNWRPGSVRTVVWIGDAPPHGVECAGDAFPDGCPCGRHWYSQAESCREMGIVVHAVGCGLRSPTDEVFRLVARTTRGLYLGSPDVRQLLPLTTGLAASELDKLLLQRRVAELLQAHDVSVLDEEEDRVEFLLASLRRENCRARRLDPAALELRFRQPDREDVKEALHRLELAAR